MVTPSFRRSAQALALLGAGWIGPLACSSDPATTTGVTHPTMIEVLPADFLGDLPCGEQPGAVRRYVATLFDVTEQLGGAGGEGNIGLPESEATAGGQGGASVGAPVVVAPGKCGGFQLPSSRPVSCLAGVGFGYVVNGRHYCAEIDAYDSDQVQPRGSGSRQMVAADAGDSAPPASDAPKVEPAWQALCRQATAATATIVPVRDCDVLSPQPDAGAPGELRVETAALLGELSCGGEPGEVERVVVELELDDYMGNRRLEVACGDATVYAALPPGRLLSLYVSAFEAGSTQAFAGAECHALAKPGTSVNATCSSLSQVGTLRVDLPAALEALGLECDEASVSDVLVNAAGTEQRLPPPDCLQPFDHGFAAGVGSVTVTVTPASGEPQALNCTNVVAPGRVVVADCSP
jgi:hypothetical protein